MAEPHLSLRQPRTKPYSRVQLLTEVKAFTLPTAQVSVVSTVLPLSTLGPLRCYGSVTILSMVLP